LAPQARGRTKAVPEGIEKLVAAIDSKADVDIDSVSETISKLAQRLDRLEARQVDSKQDIDSVTSAISTITDRLEKIEADIDSGVASIARLEATSDIAADVEQIAESKSLRLPQAPLTQMALAKRLDRSDKAVERHRKRGRKISQAGAAISTRTASPGPGRRGTEGQPLRFSPAD
jgi:chromosome segregation ATPase